MKNGIHVQYLPVNMAWAVMWFGQILSIHNVKSEAVAEADRLTR